MRRPLFEGGSDPFQGFGLLIGGFKLSVHYRQNLFLVFPLPTAGKRKWDSNDCYNNSDKYENSEFVGHSRALYRQAYR